MNYINSFEEYGYIPLDKNQIIKRKSTKVYCKSISDNLIYGVRLASLRNGTNPSWIHKNEYADSNIKYLLEKEGCVLISSNHKSTRDLITYIAQCNHENTTQLNSFLHGTGRLCSNCAKELRIDSNRLTFEEVSNILKKDNCVLNRLYINELDNRKTWIDYSASCGHNVSSRLTTYQARMQKTCNDCTLGNRAYYCIGNANKHKDEWLNISCLVYIINIFDYEESFIKIGVTTKTIKERFGRLENRSGYEYFTLEKIHSNLYDAIYIEDNLLKLNIENRYFPDKKMDGYTECFTELNKETYDRINYYKGNGGVFNEYTS